MSIESQNRLRGPGFKILHIAVAFFLYQNQSHAHGGESCTVRAAKLITELMSAMDAKVPAILNPSPTFHPTTLLKPTGDRLNALIKGSRKGNTPSKKLYYVITPDSKIYFIDEAIYAQSQGVQFVYDRGSRHFVPILETGEIRYIKEPHGMDGDQPFKRGFYFDPTFKTAEFSEDELDEFGSQIERYRGHNEIVDEVDEEIAKGPIKISRKANPGDLDLPEVIRCGELLHGRARGKLIHFFEQLAVSNATYLGGWFLFNHKKTMAAWENLGVESWEEVEEREGLPHEEHLLPGVLAKPSDFIVAGALGTNARTLVRTPFWLWTYGKELTRSQRFWWNLPVNVAASFIQGEMNDELLNPSKDPNERHDLDLESKYVNSWNYGYIGISLLVTDRINEKLYMQKMPEIIFNWCAKGAPNWAIKMGAMGIRLVEGAAVSGIIYQGGLSLYSKGFESLNGNASGNEVSQAQH